jgi:hypothetical protein
MSEPNGLARRLRTAHEIIRLLAERGASWTLGQANRTPLDIAEGAASAGPSPIRQLPRY